MVTVDEAKVFLNVTSTATDSLIASLITYTTAEIGAYLSRNLLQTVYTNEVLQYGVSDFDNYFNPELSVKDDYPKIYIENFPVQGLHIYSNGAEIPSTDYSLDTYNGSVTLFSYYVDRERSLTANYTGGYSVATSGTFVVPDALKAICLDGIKEKYKTSGVTRTGTGFAESKKVGDFLVKYNQDSIYPTGIKPYLISNKFILDSFKNVDL